jgi:hypothetical protein
LATKEAKENKGTEMSSDSFNNGEYVVNIQEIILGDYAKAVSIKLTDLTLDVLFHKLYNIFSVIMSMYIL